MLTGALMKLQQWGSVPLRGRGLVMIELDFFISERVDDGWTDGRMDGRV